MVKLIEKLSLFQPIGLICFTFAAPIPTTNNQATSLILVALAVTGVEAVKGMLELSK